MLQWTVEELSVKFNVYSRFQVGVHDKSGCSVRRPSQHRDVACPTWHHFPLPGTPNQFLRQVTVPSHSMQGVRSVE